MTTKFTLPKALLFLLILGLTLSSCKTRSEATEEVISEPEVPEQEILIESEEVAYPIDSGYPIGKIEEAYPMTEVETDYKVGPDFNINEPVKTGDTIVTGTGPAGVPIQLINISEIDVVLGETVINDVGTFMFELDKPLEINVSIGIKLGNISNTSLKEEDFLYNDNYYERPYIGVLFDIVYVQ